MNNTARVKCQCRFFCLVYFFWELKWCLKTEHHIMVLVSVRMRHHFIRLLKLVWGDKGMFPLLAWWLTTTVAPKVPKYHLPHSDNVFSCREINNLCHSAIHTEYNSSSHSATYCFSFLIYEVAGEALDFSLASPHSGINMVWSWKTAE